MSSNIPMARRALLGIAKDMGDTDASTAIRWVVSHLLIRAHPVRKAGLVRQRITRAEKSRIRHIAQANPDMTMQEIAVQIGIRSIGRISEVLNGKR